MTLRNNRERGVDVPRRLTPAEHDAVQARRPVRYVAAQNVARTVEMSFPWKFAPLAEPVAAPGPSNEISFGAYRAPNQMPGQLELSDASQAELARQAITTIFSPGQEQADAQEAA